VLLWGGGAAVSVLFAWLALRDVDWAEAWRALHDCNYWWLVPSFAALALTIPVKTLRWRYLYHGRTRPPFGAAMDALLVGLFFNTILPARAGEAARVVALNRSAGTSKAESVATIVLERVLDVLALLVMLFVAVPWLPHVNWLRTAAVLAIVLAAVVVAAVVVILVFGERPLRLLLRPLGRLPFLGEQRVEALIANVHHGLAGIRSVRLAAAASALTVAAWLLLSLSTWLLMRGFDLRLPFLSGLLVVVAVNLALIVPSSPGGLGVFEAATLVALHAYGIPDSRAVSYALVLHAVNLIPYLVAGVAVTHVHATGRRRAKALP
jgi:uncharacterized protein (TIRG00374 family)